MTTPPPALYADLRRLLDAIEALLERETSPVSAPLQQMLADLSDIRESLTLCAVAMQTTADLTRTLAARPDPMPELQKIHERLDKLGAR